MVAPPHFDHERLDVYQLELKFLSWVTDARGSAIECAAWLEASVAKGFASLDRIQAGKELFVRVIAMLTKLLMLFRS